MGKKTIYKSSEGKRLITQHYENYLKSFEFDIERFYVETSFGKTHVLAAGPKAGKPIFILQGGNCINPMTLSWFLPIIEHYRIYAPDTIGHPGYSDDNRISAKDKSFAQWINELMDHFNIEHCSFIGPSYGGGIILRLASFMPEKIDCAVLVSPAGITLGSKMRMMKEILLPLLLFNRTSSEKYLDKITGNMSNNTMKEIDKRIIGDVFKYIRLEQDMPKLTKREELAHYTAPTMVIAGEKDLFFPENRVRNVAKEVIPNLVAVKAYDMGHFPSETHLVEINREIINFLKDSY